MTSPSPSMDFADPKTGSPWGCHSRGEALARLATALLFGLVTLIWILAIVQSSNREALLHRDWILFQRVGQQFLAGDLQSIYKLDPEYPFLYPPFVIYLCVPIALVPPGLGYAACIVLELAMLAGTLWTLWKFLPASPGEHLTIWLAVLGSAPWLGVIVTGHFTVLNVWFMLAGFLAWRERKTLTAGMLISGLTIKPNLGVAYGFVALFKREWRMLAGMFLCFGLLVATTLPMGIDIWRDFLALTRQLPEQVKNAVKLYPRQQNLFAFWRTILPGLSWEAINVLWAVSIVPIVAAVAWCWRGPLTSERLPRLLGITVLAIVACNPYLFFYDALLLMIPASVWFLERGTYQPRWHRASGLLLLFIYIWQHLTLWFLKGGPALVGFAVAGWVILESLDLAGRATGVSQGRGNSLDAVQV